MNKNNSCTIAHEEAREPQDSGTNKDIQILHKKITLPLKLLFQKIKQVITKDIMHAIPKNHGDRQKKHVDQSKKTCRSLKKHAHHSKNNMQFIPSNHSDYSKTTTQVNPKNKPKLFQSIIQIVPVIPLIVF